MDPSKAVHLDLCRSSEGDDPTTYFKDGVKKIDFILVYEDRNSGGGGGLQTQASVVTEDDVIATAGGQSQAQPDGKGKK